jgi:hypothetical protein
MYKFRETETVIRRYQKQSESQILSPSNMATSLAQVLHGMQRAGVPAIALTTFPPFPLPIPRDAIAAAYHCCLEIPRSSPFFRIKMQHRSINFQAMEATTVAMSKLRLAFLLSWVAESLEGIERTP